MSISSETNRADATGNGNVDTYPFSFKILDEADLLVTVRDTTDPDAVEQTLTLTTDYTVSGVGVSSGGSVALVDSSQDWLDADGDLLTDWHITIRRKLDIVQETDIRNQGSFLPETHEDQFDRCVMIDQQQQDEIDRAAKMPETVAASTFDPTLPASLPDNPGATVIVNDAGDGFELGPTADAISDAQTQATAAAASAAAAATSETNAAASATSAATSATSAATAAASVMWRDVVFLTSADSPYTVTSAHRGKLLSVDCTGGAVTVNLPGISGLDLSTPFVIGVKKTDSSGNAITIARNGTDTIDGNTSKTVTFANQGTVLVPDTDPAPDKWTSADFGAAAGNMTVDRFSGDGATVAFTLSVDPGSKNNTWVAISGVIQQKATYSVSGTTLTFTTAPPVGTNNIEATSGTTLSIGTPADASVSAAKLATSAITGQTADATPDPTADYVLMYDASANALKKALLNTLRTMPTRQVLTSGTSATYTTPSGARQLRVRMVGGGGGGGAQATNAGSAGGNTSFNSIVATGGGAGPAGVAGIPIAGGAGGSGGSGTADLRIAGGGGGSSMNASDCYAAPGGNSALGGGAKGTGGNTAGANGATNSGGGGGGGCGSTVTGGGGGAGEYVEFIINSPAASYTYTVGGGGNGGAAGTTAGGNGGSGVIIVDEFYG